MKAAEAPAEFLPQDTKIIDFMSPEISFPNHLTKKIYLAALKIIPDLYDRIYRLAGKPRTGTIARLFSSLSMYLPFSKLLNEFEPDVVICTHPFPEAGASLWKFLHAKSARKFLLAAVLTDYSLHEIWIYDEADIYFVATEEMKEELSRQCRPNQEIYATGIPINPEFSKVVEKKSSGKKNILIMGGGLGLGSIEETLKDLDEISLPVKITVVTGQNESLFSRLKNLQKKLSGEVEILGSVNNVPELMRESDLLITKPGALTMSEAFSQGLPMVLHSPIPGPEKENAAYAVKGGAAVSAGKEKISAIVEGLLKNPERLEEMKSNAKKLGRPYAAKKIAEIITSACNSE